MHGNHFSIIAKEAVTVSVIKTRSRAIECEFKCPGCKFSLDDYLLTCVLVMGLGDPAMESAVLHNFRHVKFVSDMLEMYEEYESAIATVIQVGVSTRARSGPPRVKEIEQLPSNQDPDTTAPGEARCKSYERQQCTGSDACPTTYSLCSKCSHVGPWARRYKDHGEGGVYSHLKHEIS